MTSSETELRHRAEQRVAAKLGFRSHLLIFLLVNGGLAVLNLVTSPTYLWCLWVIFGWGIGLATHGLGVYGRGDADRERMIESELDRLRRKEERPLG